MKVFKRKKSASNTWKGKVCLKQANKGSGWFPGDRWQEEEKFFNCISSLLFSMKENNPQSNENNIYKEKLDLLPQASLTL